MLGPRGGLAKCGAFALIASRRFLITSAGFFGHSTMWPSGRHLYCESRDLPNDFSFATFLAVFFIAYPSVSVLELKVQESCGPPVAGRGAVASVRDGPTGDWRQSKSSTAAAPRAWSRSFVSVTVNSRSRKYWSNRARRGSQQ